MATKRKLSPKRGAASARMTLDDLNSLLIYREREHLADKYGSLEAARERLDMLERTNQWHRRAGQLPPFVWWATEPGVPEDLCQDEDLYIDLTADRKQPWPENAIDALESLEVLQWRWLAATGRMTPEDRADIERYAERMPRFAEILEAIGAAQVLDAEGQHD
jgi:hypothetical protein